MGVRDYIPRPHAASAGKADRADRIPLRNPDELDSDVGHRWLVECSYCRQTVLKIFNHRMVSKGVFFYRALRGFWLLNPRTGLLFGRGGGKNERKSCQQRLPGDYDVKAARHRRKEKRILQGRLLKMQVRNHTPDECTGQASPMNAFTPAYKLIREFDPLGRVTKDENDDA